MSDKLHLKSEDDYGLVAQKGEDFQEILKGTSTNKAAARGLLPFLKQIFQNQNEILKTEENAKQRSKKLGGKSQKTPYEKQLMYNFPMRSDGKLQFKLDDFKMWLSTSQRE